MLKKLFAITIATSATLLYASAQNNDSAMLARLAGEVMYNSTAHQNLRILCKDIGPRLSGSANAAKAVERTAQMLRDAGADTVYLQPCMVPRWQRGQAEVATVYYQGKSRALKACALGMSVATPLAGLRAPIIQVNNFDELKALGADKVKGKIVFFNYRFRPDLFGGGDGDAVRYRSAGPVEAARLGAVGVIIRSVTNALDYNPHTGATRYDSTVQKIPAMAMSTMDAEWLSNLLRTNTSAAPQLFMKMNCRQLDDVLSYNVVGELRGSEKPEEIITAGGHLDSWDLAEGAHDDGTGCVQSIEIIRAIKALGWKPKRTIRAVMFMNEENGGRGGQAYAEAAKKETGNKYLFAIESDAGGFGAITLGLSATPAQFEKAQAWAPLLRRFNVYGIPTGGGGADINPLRPLGTALCGVNPASLRYFDFHHAPNDRFEAVHKQELDQGALAMAAICWLVSEYGL